jgi:hypothetical protein
LEVEPEGNEEVEELSPGLVDELYDFTKMKSELPEDADDADDDRYIERMIVECTQFKHRDSLSPQRRLNLCIVCKSNEADCQFEDCGHICACEDCATQADACPYCKLLKQDKGHSGRRKSIRLK